MGIAVTEETKDALRKLKERYPLYINSATPDDSLRTTLSLLGIETFFRGIYGGSLGKVENLRLIAHREGVRPDEMIFVGDSAGDMHAAHEFGCHFLAFARITPLPWAVTVPTVSSIAEIIRYC